MIKFDILMLLRSSKLIGRSTLAGGLSETGTPGMLRRYLDFAVVLFSTILRHHSNRNGPWNDIPRPGAYHITLESSLLIDQKVHNNPQFDADKDFARIVEAL